jgi:hypothetical protein
LSAESTDFPGEVLVMIKDSELALEPGPIPLSVEHAPPRKPYESPRLLEWGSIAELTKGPLSGTIDGDFSGSGGV